MFDKHNQDSIRVANCSTIFCHGENLQGNVRKHRPYLSHSSDAFRNGAGSGAGRRWQGAQYLTGVSGRRRQFSCRMAVSGIVMPVKVGISVPAIAEYDGSDDISITKVFRHASRYSFFLFSFRFPDILGMPVHVAASDRRVACRLRCDASAGGMCAGRVLPICPEIMTSVNAAY